MKVVEQFKTLQGEGRYLGVPSYFIRTTGCNLRCAWKNPNDTITICDTPYTSFNPEKGSDLDIEQVLKTLKDSNIKHVVITGGEPTLQKDLSEVVNRFIEQDYHVTIETNGTRYVPDIPLAFMSISPKTGNSYNQVEGSVESKLHQTNNSFMEPIGQFVKTNLYQLKFVFSDERDIAVIESIRGINKIPRRNIYLMPQGISREQFKEKEQKMFELCVKYGYNYSPRMHVDVFGNKRGI